MVIPDGIAVALLTLGVGGFLTWVAYVSKMLLEHAKLLAVLIDREGDTNRQESATNVRDRAANVRDRAANGRDRAANEASRS